MKVYVGDRILAKIDAVDPEINRIHRQFVGSVIYVHPEGRFCTASFELGPGRYHKETFQLNRGEPYDGEFQIVKREGYDSGY